MSRHNEDLKVEIFVLIIESYVTIIIEENSRRTVEECHDISKLCHDIYYKEGGKLCRDTRNSCRN